MRRREREREREREKERGREGRKGGGPCITWHECIFVLLFIV